MLYNLSAEQFSKWIEVISRISPRCAVTFDDGNKSDIEIALPILKKYDITAIFFPIINRVGMQDYMTWDDIHTLMKADMEIGSHGLEHVAWAECSDNQLLKELQHSREILDTQLKHPIDRAAAPFGAISPRVYHAAKKAGYTKLYSSSSRSSFTGSHTHQPRLYIS